MRRDRSTQPGSNLEALESRQLLTINYDPVSQWLFLDGTLGADYYEINLVTLPSGVDAVQVVERPGPTVQTLPVTSHPIAQIWADLDAGNDQLFMSADLSIPLTASGDDGHDLIQGGSGPNAMFGDAGHDTLLGSSDQDTLEGGDDHDVIEGHDSNDILNGGFGNDIIDGGTGDDEIDGSLGDDILYGREGKDTIDGGDDSNDLIEGGPDDDLLDGEDGRDTVLGEDGDDTIFGGFGDDSLEGGNGDDTIEGNDGDDFASGGDGADSLNGGTDNDTLEGGPGSDTLRGLHDDDSLRGDGADDILEGGDGNDTLDGLAGDDVLRGEEGLDVLNGGADDDTLEGGPGNDTLSGNAGHDRIKGNADDDSLVGADGRDTLQGGSGNDTLSGGKAGDLLKGGSGHDDLSGNRGPDHLDGGNGNDTLSGGDGRDGLLPWGGDDEVWGDAGHDRFLKMDDASVSDANSEFQDLGGDDVKIKFDDHVGGTVTVNGQDIDVDPGLWTGSEIMALDEALDVLAERTNNNELLERKSGNTITFERAGALSDPDFLGWNGGKRITFADGAFVDDDTLHLVTFHEIGHNWDKENPQWGDWKDISGWRKNNAFTNQEPWESLSGDGAWFYESSSGFARTYGQWSPDEDFATSFAKALMIFDSRTYPYFPVGDDSSKQVFVEDFLDDLSS